MNKKNIDGYITSRNRKKAIKDFNYGEVVSSGCEEFDLPRMSIIEYKNGEKIYEDYTELDFFLEQHFIPTYIKRIDKNNDLNDENKDNFIIPLNRIVDLKLNHDEFVHVCNYLNNEGIIIRGRAAILDEDISNYEYITTYKSHDHKCKYEKNLEEEIKMFKELRKTNDKNIREKLILNNIRIAHYLAEKYEHIYNVDVYELESYAYEALCKTVDNFDYTIGLPFSSYAYPVIQKSILNGVATIKNKYRDGHFSVWYFKVKKYINKLEKENNRKISEDQNLINDVLDLMIKEGVITLRQRNTFKKYIYSNLDLSFDTDNIDILLDDVYEDIERNLYLEQLEKCFEEILANDFSEREIFIIKNRFGFNGKKPKYLEEIGIELGLSKERVRQIEKIILLKFKNKYSKKLKVFLKDSIDIENTIDLYDYIEEDNYYSDDIYNENYDYKKSLKR